ncbi:hypothetical protein PG985_002783 [Apiospora marii]|uniref:Uncharacterized protein n=1 Tax=Apiospora marii TaxID=335849 RepID=A0ABR1RTQ9_9PEZI
MAEYLVYFVVCVVRSVTVGTVLILDPLEFAMSAKECDKRSRTRTGGLPPIIEEGTVMSQMYVAIVDCNPPKCVGRLLTSDLQAAGQLLDVKALRHAIILPISMRAPSWQDDALEVFEGPAPDRAQWETLEQRPGATTDEDDYEDMDSEPNTRDRIAALDAELEDIQKSISATLDQRDLCKQGLVEDGGHDEVGPADAVRLVEEELEELYKRKFELQARRDRIVREHPYGRFVDGMGARDDDRYEYMSPAEKDYLSPTEKNRKRVWDILLADENLGPHEKRLKSVNMAPHWYKKGDSATLAAHLGRACDISPDSLRKGGDLLFEAETIEKSQAGTIEKYQASRHAKLQFNLNEAPWAVINRT